MAILIDPPAWPAHGTLWSHLISDSDYEELHAFAARLPIPRRGFDLDHYDVPASLYARAIALGARPVDGKSVVHSLRTSGLRVRQFERAALRPVRRRQYLQSEWSALAGIAGVGTSSRAHEQWHLIGEQLISRWNEPHRRYHDEQHLEDVLLALDQLATRGERLSAATLLAAWFHDAVYTGSGGSDELDSAKLATDTLSLDEFGIQPGLVNLVGELIVATTPAQPIQDPPTPFAHLLDADLAIFASPQHRYEQYSVAVRAEYQHVAPAEFRVGRARILSSYIDQPTVYRTSTAQLLWEERARANLAREISELRGG